MAEYIDREALRKILENWRDAHADVDDEHGCGLLEDVIWEVDAQPAADVIDNTHGKWLHITRYNEGERMIATCSRCRERGEVRTTRTMFGLWEIDSPFCPSCGVEMDGKDDN